MHARGLPPDTKCMRLHRLVQTGLLTVVHQCMSVSEECRVSGASGRCFLLRAVALQTNLPGPREVSVARAAEGKRGKRDGRHAATQSHIRARARTHTH